MNFSANVCPTRKTKNQLEAIFCENCGVKLDAPFMDSEHISKTTDMQALTPETVRDWSLKEAKELAVPESGIAFYVDGQSIPAYSIQKEILSWVASLERRQRYCLILLHSGVMPLDYPDGTRSSDRQNMDTICLTWAV